MMKNQNIKEPKIEAPDHCKGCGDELSIQEIDEFGTVCYPCDAMPDMWVLDFENINEPMDELI